MLQVILYSIGNHVVIFAEQNNKTTCTIFYLFFIQKHACHGLWCFFPVGVFFLNDISQNVFFNQDQFVC